MMRSPNANYYQVKRAYDIYFRDTNPARGYGWKAFKRWEWRVQDRMLPDGTVQWNSGALNEAGFTFGSPSGGKGVMGIGGGTSGAAPCPGSGRWTPVGPVNHPYNQSGQPTGIGRINGIAFHPSDSNTLFALAPQGGVWKTTNNGQTWQHLFGAGPVVNTIGVSTMVLSYNNADTMYIGTGDRDAGDAPGFGVLWSTDGGKTWSTRNNGMGNRIVGKIIMHPRNSAILIAATNGGVYRTTNSGASWTTIISSGNFVDIDFHPSNPDIVYTTRNGLFFRSTNNGQSFTQITSGLPASSSRGQIAVSKANRGIVYFVTSGGSSLQGFYRSTDSGQNFTARIGTTPNILGYYDGTDMGNGQGWYDLDIDADPRNADVVFVGGVNIWKSVNGGLNWTQVGHWYGGFGADDIHADQHATEFNNTGSRLYSGNDGGIYYSLNHGSRWVNISSGIQSSQIYRMAHARTDEFISAEGYQDNGSSQTTRDEFYTYYGGDGMDCQVDPTDASYVYGAYVYGRIYRAINKNTIITVGANGTGGINEGGNWLTPFVLQEGQPGTMFAGYSNVWRTTNLKTGNPPSWVRISTSFGGIRMLESSMARNQMLYVLQNSGNMQRTGNANATAVAWVSLGTGPGGVRWIEAHHKDSNRVYCVNGSSLYRSTNKGASWTAIATPSGAGSLNTCIIDTSSKTELIYIGTERGVYVWDSAANQVVNFNNGFPVWGDVTDLDIWYSPKGNKQSKVLASTYGRGVWRSNMYDPGTLKPKSAFYAFDSVFTVDGTLKLYEKAEGTATSFAWKITPYSYSYINGTDSSSSNPVIRFSKKGVYTVQLIASNCQGYDTAVRKSWIRVFDKQVDPFCKTTANFQTQSVGIGVFKVALADNESETGGYFDDGQYLDMRKDKVFRVKPSTTYTVSVKTGLYNNEYVRMFIDYSGDGRFQNWRSEALPATGWVFGNRTFTFTTPSSPRLNRAMTFRVISDYNPIDTNACLNLSYGQGEDYTLVFDQPVPYFKADKLVVCANENVTFTDTSDGLVSSWDWDFGSGASPQRATGQGPHVVKYTTTGNKAVRLRINGSDSVRKTSYITVNQPADPYIVVKTGINPGCEGRSITLAVRDKNNVTAVRQWKKNGSNLSGKTDSLLVFNPVALSDSGFYTVLFDNSGCLIESATVKLVTYIKPKAAFVFNTANTQCLRGNRFGFTNNSSSAQGSMNYKWDFGNSTGSVVDNPFVTYSTIGDYTIKLVTTTSFGCKDSVSVNYAAVKPNPKSAFTVNDSDQCLSGNNFIFTNNSVAGAGSNIASRRWDFGDGTNSVLSAPSKTYSSRASYVVSLINTTNWNCSDTFRKPVRVYGQSAMAFTLNNNDQCLKGNRYQVTNSSVASDGTLSYLWTYGDGRTSTVPAPVFTYSSSGSYTVRLRGTTSFGCRDSISRTVNVWPQASPAFSINDDGQCLRGNDYRFTNLSSISSGSLSYNWNMGDGFVSVLKDPSRTYTNFGTYQVRLITISDKGCRDTTSKSVQVYAMPVAGFTPDRLNACLRGNLFTFAGKGSIPEGSFTTAWKYGDGATGTGGSSTHSYTKEGTYKIVQVLTSDQGCIDSTTSSVEVYPMPKAAFTATPAALCVAERGFMSNESVISYGKMTHEWNFGNGQIRVADTSSTAYATHGSFTIRQVSMSEKGCSDTARFIMNVSSNPVAAFTALPNPACALQSRVDFTNQSTNADGKALTSAWNFGNGVTSGGTNASHIYNTKGVYKAQLQVNNGKCADTASVWLRIVDPVSAAFVSTVINKETREFTATDTLVKGYDYLWSFGDGSLGSGYKTRHMFPDNKTYPVKLFIRNTIGCRDSSEVPVVILSPNYKDQSNALNFYVYPNPTTGKFTYKFELKSTETVSVKLYDILGQTAIYTADWENMAPGTHFETVDMKKLNVSAGTYPLIITGGGSTLVVKIIYTGE